VVQFGAQPLGVPFHLGDPLGHGALEATPPDRPPRRVQLGAAGLARGSATSASAA
jgi:hypothetical protein